MRIARGFCAVLLLCILLLGITPAQAAVILVDPTQPSGITASATVAKIARLQNYVNYSPVSEISPDDQSLLVFFSRGFAEFRGQLAFLNEQDGSTKTISDSLIPSLTNPVWADNQNLVYIGLVDEQQPVLVVINRQSGTVKSTAIDLPGFPLSLSPDASRLLFAVPAQSTPATQAFNPLKSPFDQEIKRSFSQPSEQNEMLARLFPAVRQKLSGLDTAAPDALNFSSQSLTLGVLDLTSDKAAALFTTPGNVGIADVAWSADSSHLALVRTVLPTGSTEGTRLADLATQDGLGKLPPTKNPFLQGNVVDTIDFNAGKVNQGFLKASDLNTDVFANVAWNTDGSKLVTTMYSPAKLGGRTYPVYLSPERSYLRFYISGQTSQYLTLSRDETDAPGAIRVTFVSPDEVLINKAAGTNVSIYYYNSKTDTLRQLPTQAGEASSVRATHQSHQVVFNYSSFGQAPEMFRINFDGTALYELSFLNQDLTNAGKVQYNAVSFTLASGEKRGGYLLQPQGAAFPPKNVPLIVWQEGGPTSPFINRWGTNVEAPFNLLTNFGYNMLFVPLEGRIGFGPQRLNALADNKNFGQIDVDEMAEIVQQTIDRGYTARGSVGITGCSYGGYFTSQSIVRHPDLYAAANTQCTLLDLFREFQSGQTPYISYLEGRTSIDDPAEYTKDSPVLNAKQVKAATLIFDGVNDFLPYQVSVNFHDQLQANGLATNMLLFKREGHGLFLPNNQLIAAQSQLAWFQQFLPKPPQ